MTDFNEIELEQIQNFANELVSVVIEKSTKIRDDKPLGFHALATELIQIAAHIKLGCGSENLHIDRLTHCAGQLLNRHVDELLASKKVHDDDRKHCRGCKHYQEFDGYMICLDMISYEGGTPYKPPCFVYSDELTAKIEEGQRLRETLGEDHPATQAAIVDAIMLSPPSIREEIDAEAEALGLMPKPAGYTDDGKPMFSVQSIADKFDTSVDDVIQKAQEIADATGRDLIFDGGNINRVQ
jgi:hypothetical protein